MKILFCGIKSRLDTAEEKVHKPEGIAIELSKMKYTVKKEW